MFDKVIDGVRNGFRDGKSLGASVMAQAALGDMNGSMDALGEFADDSRAQGANGAVNLVVALVVGGLMAAFLLPIVIDELATVDTASWSDGAAALWGILPVMIVLAVFLFFVGVALRRSGRL